MAKNMSQITKVTWLRKIDLLYIKENLAKIHFIASKLGFLMDFQEHLIVLSANRGEYSVEICVVSDDNLTGLPKLTVGAYSDLPLFSILLEEVADQEVRRFVEMLFSPTTKSAHRKMTQSFPTEMTL